MTRKSKVPPPPPDDVLPHYPPCFGADADSHYAALIRLLSKAHTQAVACLEEHAPPSLRMAMVKDDLQSLIFALQGDQEYDRLRQGGWSDAQIQRKWLDEARARVVAQKAEAQP